MIQEKKAKLIKIALKVISVFFLSIILFIMFPGVHCVDNYDGWPRGGALSGFPLPYLWPGSTSLSYEIFVPGLLLNLLFFISVSLILVLISSLVFRKLKNANKLDLIWYPRLKLIGSIFFTILFLYCLALFLFKNFVFEINFVFFHREYFPDVQFRGLW